MFRLTALIAISSLASIACSSDDPGTTNPGQGSDDNSRALRSAEASTAVITLSAELAGAAAGSALANATDGDVKQRVDGISGADCGLLELSDTSISVDFDDCPEMSGTIEIVFANGACLDPENIDPTCFDELDVSVTTSLEVEGIRIAGNFNLVLTDGLIDSDGSLEVDVNGDELDVDFDLELREDGDCELISGTLDVTTSEGSVSVTAENLLDCGDCPESGSLSVEAGGDSVSIDFDSGNIEIIGDGGVVETTLTCESAI